MKTEVMFKEKKFAERVIHQCIPLTRRIQKGIESLSLTKGDKSPVTVADFTVQAITAKILSETFPNDGLMGEESSAMLRQPDGAPILEKVTQLVREVYPNVTEKEVCDWLDYGKGKTQGRFWTLDPIDGTRGFIRGEHYATAFALIEDGEILMGAVGCPHLSIKGTSDFNGLGVLAIAMRGQGAFIAPMSENPRYERIQVSSVSDPSAALLLGSVEPSHTDQNILRKLTERLKMNRTPILMDSLAKYVALACGHGDVFMYPVPQGRPHYRMKIWDVAPGAIIVQEAGGKVTDFLGHELGFSEGDTMPRKNPGLVITNGKLHQAVVSAVSALG